MLSAPTCSSVETQRTRSNVSVVEGQVAHVGLDAGQSRDVGFGEVDAGQLREAGPQQRGEVRRLRERVPHLERALAGEPREHPRDLDHALVGPGRPLQPARPLAALARTAGECDPVVEQPDPLELGRAASSCTSVARDSVPSSSFASARSRASGSGSRRSTSAKTASTKSSSEPLPASSQARSSPLTNTSRSPGPTCGRAARPGRTGAAAGTARTSGCRARRGAPP